MPVRGKVILVTGATGHDGTVDHSKVEEWSGMYADSNVALRADGWIGLDVDAYDGKVGDQTLAALEAELGELPYTITSTSRGPDQPSRIHLYRIPDPKQRFITKFTDLEVIQRSHRYAVCSPSIHPETGQRYEFYGYEGELLTEFPAIDDLEALPEAWLERLSLPDLDIPEGAGYSGSVQEWLERVPQGSMGFFVADRVAQIPKTPFGHDVLISLQASIVAQAAAGDTGAPEALGILRREWLRGEYDTAEYARAFDAALESAIKKFGALPDRPEDILKQDQVSAAIKVQNPTFLDLWTSLPRVITEESLSERAARVMSLALDEGLSVLEAASLGWHSAAAQHPLGVRENGLEAVWALALDAAAHPVRAEGLHAVEPEAKAEVTPLLPKRTVELLTQAEAARRSTITWWGDEFMEVMREMHSVISEPYYRLNRWIILSLCFAHKAVIPLEDGTMVPLNFYGIALGPSKSGKSEAVRPIKEIGKLFWIMEQNPDIGGDATRSALHKALVQRDGNPTLFRSDEADAVIRSWSDSRGPFAGMKQFVTEVYDGEASAFLRQGDQEDSQKHARAYLNVHLTGIDEEIADSIEPRDWRSGFINRFVWARGERKPRDRSQKRTRILRGGAAAKTGGKEWYGTWASRFQTTGSALFQGTGPGNVDFTDEVLDRHIDTIESFERIAQNSSYADRLDTTFGRLETTILKCAALIAITNNRRRVEMDDYIIALEQAEEWAENILHMVEATDESPRARRAERLYGLLVAHHGTRTIAEIMSHKAYRGESKDAEGLLHELEQQGRVEKLDLRPQGGELIYRVVKEEAGK